MTQGKSCQSQRELGTKALASRLMAYATIIKGNLMTRWKSGNTTDGNKNFQEMPMLCSVQINRCVFNSDDQRLIYLTVMENMVGEKKTKKKLHSNSELHYICLLCQLPVLNMIKSHFFFFF